jgi:TM2 domain-containing membrane protein YozV
MVWWHGFCFIIYERIKLLLFGLKKLLNNTAMKSIIFSLAMMFATVSLSAQNAIREIPVVKDGNKIILLKPAKPQIKLNTQQRFDLQPLTAGMPSLQVIVPQNMQNDMAMPILNQRLTPNMDMNLQAMYLSDRKDPALSTTLSMLVPGLGQIYNGQVAKGVGFLAAAYGSLGVAAIASSNGNRSLAAAGFATAAVAYIWSFLDAAFTSNAMNKHKGLIDISLNGKDHLTAQPSVSSLKDTKGNYLPGSTNAGLAIAYAF